MFFWILVIIFIFLQAAGLPIDGVTWLALWALMTWPAKRAWMAVFGLGLVFDIVQGEIWGWTSLIYLMLGMVLWLYRKKYYPYHPVFLWLFFTGSSLLVSWLVRGEIEWIQAGLAGLLVVVLRGRIVETQQTGGLRLKY